MDALSFRGADVEMDQVRKSYHKNEVLKGISFRVPAGSFASFLGPSGSGKTTSLSILAGLTIQDAGSIYIDGQDCSSMPVHKRNLGFVFQNYALFPHLTVRRNIAYPLTLRKIEKKEIDKRVHEALEIVKLTSHADKFPSQLSGGQQQRVSLARAFVFNPKVLLMDEPLGALDAGLRIHLQREIVKIGRDLGVTIIYVTHDQSEALTMSDQIILFNEGRVEQIGAPEDLYECPTSEFAARFIGGSPLFSGRLVVSETGWRLAHDKGAFPVDERAVSASRLAHDQVVSAVLRSENIVVCHDGCSETCESNFIGVATIADIIYGGASIKVVYRLEGGIELSQEREVSEYHKLVIGEVVRLSVSRKRLPAVVPK